MTPSELTKLLGAGGIFKKIFLSLFSECKQVRGRGIESQTGSALSVLSPSRGLVPGTVKSRPQQRSRVDRLTN